MYRLIKRMVTDSMTQPLKKTSSTGTQINGRYAMVSCATEIPMVPNINTININSIKMIQAISESHQGKIAFL